MKLFNVVTLIFGFDLFLFLTYPLRAKEAEATVGNRSQAQVLQSFPAIGIAGSESNKRYIAAVEEVKKKRPELFSAQDWPMKIALEVFSLETLEAALKTKDAKTISIEAQRFRYVEKALEREINSLGLLLQKKGSDLESLVRSAPSVKSASDRLRKNAQVNDQYVPFNASDTAHKVKAEEQRREADVLLTKFESSVEKLTSEEKEIRDGISAKFLLVQKKESRTRNAPLLEPLETERDALKQEHAGIRAKYGEPKQVYIQKKLDPKDFPGFDGMLYQITVLGESLPTLSLLLTHVTEFKSTGRAEVHCRPVEKTQVILTNGFSKDVTVFEETIEDALKEQRLSAIKMRLRELTASIDSLTR